MPCSKCKSDFNVLNWKTKCAECDYHHCIRCLNKVDGHYYCETCSILLKRPPDKELLMKLKVRDITSYLTRNNISVHGLVEKQELVDLFFKNGKTFKKNGKKSFNGSIPNLSNLQAGFSNLRNNAEAAFQTISSFGQSRTNTAGPSTSSHSTYSAGTSNRTTYPNAQASGMQTFHVNLDDGTVSQQSEMHDTNPVVTTSRFKKITDFKSLDELSVLAPKELKELLALNRVDYKGCVEKSELLAKVNILWIEANFSHSDEDEKEGCNIENSCKICMDAPLDCVLLECGHIATCIDCGKKLSECPICRQYVIRVVRTFKA